MTRPCPLEPAGQTSMRHAVKRSSESRTGRDVGQIAQSPEVSPQWLRHGVAPPKRDAMPFFMRIAMLE